MKGGEFFTNSKTLLIIFAVLVGAAAILGFKVMLGNNSSANGTAKEGATISLSTNPNPLRTGPATFVVDVKDKDGKPVDNANVSFDINMTTMNMGTQQGAATSQSNGKYSASGNMSMRGPWRVRTKTKMPDGETINKDFMVNVP